MCGCYSVKIQNAIGLGFILFLASCATTPAPTPVTNPPIEPTPGPDVPTPPIGEPILPPDAAQYQLLFGETSFNELPSWNTTDISAARRALIRSCARISNRSADEYLSNGAPYSGKVADWQNACDKAKDNNINDRDFWRENFTPWRVEANEEQKGRLTSYFEPIFHASLNQNQQMSEPLYGRPNDLMMLNLAAYDATLSGQTAVGRIEAGRFVPYRARAEINTQNAPVKAWAPMGEALSLQIQGSGRLLMDDGKEYRAAFAAHNGKTFGSVARELARRNIMPANQASADAITNWFKTAEPNLAREVLNANPRTVFFDIQPITNPNDGPRGGQGVPLESGGSLAIDTRYHAYGVPVFIAADSPVLANANTNSLNRLVITQDTGGAIRGPLRGDLFWGTGTEAGLAAGRINHQAKWWVLLPKGLDPVLQGAN